MLNKYRLCFVIIGILITSLTSSSLFARDYTNKRLDVDVINATRYVINIADPWRPLTGGLGEDTDNNPIGVGQTRRVLKLTRAFTVAYEGSYVVRSVTGAFLAICTMEFTGVPGNFRNVDSNQYCIGSAAVNITVTRKKEKDKYRMADNGILRFTIASAT